MATALLGLGSLAAPVHAQDLEPRRWSQLPTGINFVGVGLAYSDGDIFLDPVLEIEDASVQLLSAGVSYVRSVLFTSAFGMGWKEEKRRKKRR